MKETVSTVLQKIMRPGIQRFLSLSSARPFDRVRILGREEGRRHVRAAGAHVRV